MVGAMNRRERALATAELQQGLADFWHDVDVNWGKNASRFYSEEGVYESGKLKLEGREAIQRFYDWREERGERVAVHAFTNFRAEFDDKGGAVANWYMLLYAADGAAPQPSAPASRISRATEHYRWDEKEARWLCTYRKLENLFKGDAQLNVPTDLAAPKG
jgi:hypothetical protein